MGGQLHDLAQWPPGNGWGGPAVEAYRPAAPMVHRPVDGGPQPTTWTAAAGRSSPDHASLLGWPRHRAAVSRCARSPLWASSRKGRAVVDLIGRPVPCRLMSARSWCPLSARSWGRGSKPGWCQLSSRPRVRASPPPDLSRWVGVLSGEPEASGTEAARVNTGLGHCQLVARVGPLRGAETHSAGNYGSLVPGADLLFCFFW